MQHAKHAPGRLIERVTAMTQSHQQKIKETPDAQVVNSAQGRPPHPVIESEKDEEEHFDHRSPLVPHSGDLPTTPSWVPVAGAEDQHASQCPSCVAKLRGRPCESRSSQYTTSACTAASSLRVLQKVSDVRWLSTNTKASKTDRVEDSPSHQNSIVQVRRDSGCSHDVTTCTQLTSTILEGKLWET